MSDHIKHECGIALIRLLKPLEHYQKKYGTKSYGVNKMYLMMEKQHNRGQDGAGLATVKINAKVLWLQLGISSNEAKTLVEKNNIEYIENRCTKMEYQKIFLKKSQAFPVLINR